MNFCILTSNRFLFPDFVNTSPNNNHTRMMSMISTINNKGGMAYVILTKTSSTLAVMQGLRPLFLSDAGLHRSKLRQTGIGKKQPSCLRLASQQAKP